jgi:hypothetical protein
VLCVTTPEAYGGFLDDIDVILPPSEKPPAEKPEALAHNPASTPRDTKSKAKRSVTVHTGVGSPQHRWVYSSSCLRKSTTPLFSGG